MTDTRIAAIRLACANPERTAGFYADAFGCTVEPKADGTVLARLGDERLEFVRATAPGAALAPSNATAFQHCAIIVRDMDEAMRRLDAVSGWTPISLHGPENLPEASGGATAFKFRDPDGHPLEFLEFPAGAVPEIWRRFGAGPVLGIDHSAITVTDTDRAVAFWTGLGFRVTDRHVNRGAEQARMDGFDAEEAVVEVTTLMPPGVAPPHLELLCYLDPPATADAAPDGSPLATTLLFDGGRAQSGRDPDGHRFRVEAS